MTLIVLNAVCNCFICFFEVLCSWLMTLICRFRPSLATAQTNRFALRLARDSVQRGHTVPPAGVHANRTLVVLLFGGSASRVQAGRATASGLGADRTSHTPHSECPSHAGQHDQLQQRQAEQQACENHENDANEFETKSLSDGRN